MSGDDGPNGIHDRLRGAVVVGVLVGLGDDVGVLVGLLVGELVGDLVGLFVGLFVGLSVGLVVGDDGSIEGELVGDSVGSVVLVAEGSVSVPEGDLDGDVGSVVVGDGVVVEPPLDVGSLVAGSVARETGWSGSVGSLHAAAMSKALAASAVLATRRACRSRRRRARLFRESSSSPITGPSRRGATSRSCASASIRMHPPGSYRIGNFTHH